MCFRAVIFALSQRILEYLLLKAVFNASSYEPVIVVVV